MGLPTPIYCTLHDSIDLSNSVIIPLLSSNMVLEPNLSAALTLGVAIPLLAADVEVLKQRLDALVVIVEAAEEKAVTARRRVLAARQLLDEEQAAAAVLERQVAAKKLVPESTSFSTTETVTPSLSYVDTIVANLHNQTVTMMEEIHLGTSGPTAAPTAFYSNKTLSAPLSPPLAPPRPPGKNNGSDPGNCNGSNNNQHRNNNRRNDGSGGKNSDNGGNHGGSFPRRHHQRRSGSPAMADVCEPVAGAHRHVPWPVAHRPAMAAGFHGHDRALHPTGLCPRAAAAVPSDTSCVSSELDIL
jgi:hypothetical protein